MTEQRLTRMELPDNAWYPCQASSQWFASVHGPVHKVDFGTYLAVTTDLTGVTSLPENRVDSVEEIEMDSNERPFFGYVYKAGFTKEPQLPALDPPWAPYFHCPRNGCPYFGSKHLTTLQNLRRHYRYNCSAPEGPKHECDCRPRCAEYTLDLGPEIPEEGFSKFRMVKVAGRNQRMVEAGWFYKDFEQEFNEYDIVRNYQPAAATQDLIADFNEQTRDQIEILREQTRVYQKVVATHEDIQVLEQKYAKVMADNETFLLKNQVAYNLIEQLTATMTACKQCAPSISNMIITNQGCDEQDQGEQTDSEESGTSSEAADIDPLPSTSAE